MKRQLPIYILFIFLLSCGSNGNTDGLLQQPPYNRLTDSLQDAPQNAGLYYRRGVLLYGNNEKDYAEKDLKKAWSLQPTEQHALSVVTVLAEQHPDSAIAFISHALKSLPESVALQVALARGYQQKKDPEKALAVCNSLLQQHPNSLDALLLKAELEKSLDKNEAALATLEKAYSYAPFDAELAYNLAFAYAENKNPKVLALTDSLIRMDTSQRHAEPYYLKGVYFENIGKTAQAMQLYNTAIQHDYNFLDAYMDKGWLQYHDGQYKEALQTFRLPATITPTYADAYYWMGKCQEALGQKAEAKLNYSRAYALDKTLTEAKEAADKL